MTNARFDCRQDYEDALGGLSENPDSLHCKHQAVLALARAGSLKLAQNEFQRYGLSEVADDEDILALRARLLKDAFLQSDATNRLDLARQSANQYQVAFDKTGGYYSGINAATMTFMAEGAPHEVMSRSEDVLKRLPDTKSLAKEELYFVEATRAEAQLLLGQTERAEAALKTAWTHDPLNYTAHASTLRQLRLICAKQNSDSTWLDGFVPPRCAHFAGHMFATEQRPFNCIVLSEDDEQRLRDHVSHAIQENDIGFGYGALSAGSDILIAETLLEEGGHLHVTLPVDIEQYRSVSVTPYGESWRSRFDQCLSRAKSVSILTSDEQWPDRALNRHAAKVAMGDAILQANFLSAGKTQLLIMQPGRKASQTGDHKNDWEKTGYDTVLIDLTTKHNSTGTLSNDKSRSKLRIALCVSTDPVAHRCDSVQEAAFKAIELQAGSSAPVEIGVHCAHRSEFESVAEIAQELAKNSVPGGILVSDTFASLLAIEAEDAFASNYVGRLESGPFAKRESYSLVRRSSV